MADVSSKYGGLIFEWDEDKAKTNQRKHNVSFETARQVFLDNQRIEYYDLAHSIDEDRFVTVGMANGVLSVVYTERENDVLRLISARRATEKERRAYQHGGF